jgi:1-acyl-sn-glycerol-3-phosphate acyltransferase
MLYRFCSLCARLLCKILFKVEVQGKEKIPKSKALILASNHISFLDPVVLGAVFPYRLCFLAKEELFKNKLFSLLIRSLGSVPLKRGKTDLSAMRIALQVLRQGRSLLIFPEGGRGDLTSVKAGVGFLAQKSSVPIVIARIFGTEEALPRGEKRIRCAKVRVVFDTLANIEQGESYESISHKVLEKIKKLVYH